MVWSTTFCQSHCLHDNDHFATVLRCWCSGGGGVTDSKSLPCGYLTSGRAVHAVMKASVYTSFLILLPVPFLLFFLLVLLILHPTPAHLNPRVTGKSSMSILALISSHVLVFLVIIVLFLLLILTILPAGRYWLKNIHAGGEESLFRGGLSCTRRGGERGSVARGGSTFVGLVQSSERVQE